MLEVVRFHSPTAGAQEPAPAANRPGLRHVAYKVDDVRGVADRIREAGWETVGEIVDFENTFLLCYALLCYARRPEGLIAELAEQLPSSASDGTRTRDLRLVESSISRLPTAIPLVARSSAGRRGGGRRRYPPPGADSGTGRTPVPIRGLRALPENRPHSFERNHERTRFVARSHEREAAVEAGCLVIDSVNDHGADRDLLGSAHRSLQGVDQ